MCAGLGLGPRHPRALAHARVAPAQQTPPAHLPGEPGASRAPRPSQALEQEEDGRGGARAPHGRHGTPNAAAASDTHWPRQPRETGGSRRRLAPQPVPTGRSSRTDPPPAVKPGRRWTGRGRAGTGLGSGGRRRPRTRGLSCMSHVPTTGPRRGEPSPSTDCPGRCAGHAPHQDATPRGSLHRVALADSRIYWDRFPRGAGKGLVLAESMSTPGGQDKAPGPPTQPTRAASLPAVPESRSAPLLLTGAPHAGWTGNVPVGWPEAAWQDSPVLGGRGERAAPRQAASLLFRRCLSPTRPIFSRKARNWEKKSLQSLRLMASLSRLCI